MLQDVLQYFTGRSPLDLGRDFLDVFITYYIFYRVALVLKGTRAMQVGVGLVLVFVLYVISQLLRLHTVLTLLSAVLSSALLIGVVVFQNDIRRGLMRVGAGARFGTVQNLEGKVIDDVVEAATILARHRTGAIITFEQDANLDEFVGSHTGHRLDAAVSPELLVSLFIPEGMNKLHDGAVVIRDLRIAKAGVFFPMPEGRVTDPSFGSRHRAAIGITEETDAVVIVVSEERGSISFCFNGNIIPNLDGPRLRAALDGVFAPKRKRKRKRGWLGRWLRGRTHVEERESAVPERITRHPTLDSKPPSAAARESVTETPPRVVIEPKTRDTGEETPEPLRKRTPSLGDEASSKTGERESAPPEPLRKRQSLSSSEASQSQTDAAVAARPAPEAAPAPLRKKERPASQAKDKPADKEPTPLKSADAARGQAASEGSDDAPETRKTLESARPMPRAEEPAPRLGDGDNRTSGGSPQ